MANGADKESILRRLAGIQDSPRGNNQQGSENRQNDGPCPDGFVRGIDGTCIRDPRAFLADLESRRQRAESLQRIEGIRSEARQAGVEVDARPSGPAFPDRLPEPPQFTEPAQDVTRVQPPEPRVQPSIGPSTAPPLSQRPELREEFQPRDPGKLEQFVVAGDTFLSSLGDLSLTGTAVEGVRYLADNLQRDVSNLVRRASGGVPIDEYEVQEIQRRITNLQEDFPKTTAASNFLGAATGVIGDIATSIGAARAVSPLLPAGRTRTVVEAFGRFNQPTRLQSAAVEAAREVPIQTAVAMRDTFGLDHAVEGGVLAATFGAAFPGTRARRLALELIDDELAPSGQWRRFTFMMSTTDDRAVPMAATLDAGSKHLDIDIPDLVERGELGPREIRDAARDLLRQMDEMGVEVETIGGFRTTGARAGPAARVDAQIGGSNQITLSAERLRRNPEAGYLLMLTRDDLENITGPVREWFGRELRVAGDLPEEAFDIKFSQDSWVRAKSRETVQIAREFDRTVDDMIEAGHFNNTQEAERVVNLALQSKGRATMDLIPEGLRPIFLRMREHVDALSQRMIDDGVVQGDMIPVFQANKGMYLNRAYLAHESPDWVFEAIPPEVLNKARSYIRNQPQYQNLSSDQVDEVMKRLLFDSEDAPIQVARRTGVGSKDLSVLQRRILDSPEIRDLLGEVQIASSNFIRSSLKMSNLIGSHKFLTETKAAGLAGGWMSHANDIVPGHTARIAADASDTMYPLNGMHTTPEIARALDEAMRDPVGQHFPELYLKAVGLVKKGKTVYSPMTQVRNFNSAYVFELVNGHLFSRNVLENQNIAARTITANIGRAGPTRGFQALRGSPEADIGDVFQGLVDGRIDLDDVGQMQAVANRMTELGIMGTSARAGEVEELYKAALRNQGNDPYRIMEHMATGVAGKADRAAGELYAAGDDFHKVSGAVAEYRQLREALPESISNSEIEEMVGRLIRDQYPTYPLAPRFVRRVSLHPVVAPFATFTAESMRTGWNLLKRTYREIFNPTAIAAGADPATVAKIRQIGIKRAMGILTAGAGPAAAAGWAKSALGISDQTDQDFREGLPPWSRNSEIMWLAWDKENHTADYIDMSYTDPYNYWKKPVIAMLSGQDWEQSFEQAMRELASPFMAPDILSGAMLESIRIMNEGRENQTPIDELIMEMAQPIYEAAEPGFMSQGRRVAKGFGWIKDENGRAYSGPQELLATTTGMRVSRVDFNDMVFFRARDLRIALSDAQSRLRREATSPAEKDIADLEDRFYDVDDRRRELIGEFVHVVRAARTAGLTDRQIRAQLESADLSQSLARDIIRGRYSPYVPEEIPRDLPQSRERSRALRRLERGARRSQPTQLDQSTPEKGIEQDSAKAEALRRLRGY